MLKYISKTNKDMANGMRDSSGRPLSEDEINYIIGEIRAIDADESKFIFNDPDHMHRSTCYDYANDVVYVTRNVFPDDKYGSTHPRDLMSVRAVLAHEYYGHRTYREEYLSDDQIGNGYHTTELWDDECRASITAAKITPNLTDIDKQNLVLDAIYRANEAFHQIELDSFMKGALYGYPNDERNITPTLERIHYVSKTGETRTGTRFDNLGLMPPMQDAPDSDCHPGWGEE